MTAERQTDITLSGIQWDFASRCISFMASTEVAIDGESHDDKVAALQFGSDGRIRLQLFAAIAGRADANELSATAAVDVPRSEPLPATEGSAQPDKQTAVVLTGKLMGKAKEGRPDAKGRPTAWARFGVVDDQINSLDQYLATFHRHTRAIALTLPANAPLTAEGYVHSPAEGQSRLDTFSIFAIHNYPGRADHSGSKGVADGH